MLGFLVKTALAMSLAVSGGLVLGCAQQEASGEGTSGELKTVETPPSTPSGSVIIARSVVLNEITTIDVRPLSPGQQELRGYAVYTYLIATRGSRTRTESAICGFIGSATSPFGSSAVDATRGSPTDLVSIRPEDTALYYLPQRSDVADLRRYGARAATANYDDERARAFTARLALPDSLYLISYAGEPLPFRARPDAANLDVVEIGGLSPRRVYEYVRAYRLQLAPGGPYWRSRTTRQIGIVVAEQLSLVQRVKEMAGYLSISAQASNRESGLTSTLQPNEELPEQCRE